VAGIHPQSQPSLLLICDIPVVVVASVITGYCAVTSTTTTRREEENAESSNEWAPTEDWRFCNNASPRPCYASFDEAAVNTRIACCIRSSSLLVFPGILLQPNRTRKRISVGIRTGRLRRKRGKELRNVFAAHSPATRNRPPYNAQRVRNGIHLAVRFSLVIVGALPVHWSSRS